MAGTTPTDAGREREAHPLTPPAGCRERFREVRRGGDHRQLLTISGTLPRSTLCLMPTEMPGQSNSRRVTHGAVVIHRHGFSQLPTEVVELQHRLGCAPKGLPPLATESLSDELPITDQQASCDRTGGWNSQLGKAIEHELVEAHGAIGRGLPLRRTGMVLR